MDRERICLGHYALRHVPVEERFAAAAAAGFTGIGVAWSEVANSSHDLERVRSSLESSGLSASMLEIIRLPGTSGIQEFTPEAQRVARTAATLDCPVVLAVCLDPTAQQEVTRQGFTTLAMACAEHGRRCAIEFIPHLSSIPNLRSALELVRAAKVPGAGVVVDALHFVRSGAPWRELADLDPDEVAGIQLCDGLAEAPVADYLEEAMHMRSLPGQGQFDLRRFVASLEASGVKAPLTCEVVSDEMAKLPAEAAARRMACATQALLRGA